MHAINVAFSSSAKENRAFRNIKLNITLKRIHSFFKNNNLKNFLVLIVGLFIILKNCNYLIQQTKIKISFNLFQNFLLNPTLISITSDSSWP